jgi:hypothetical protein
MTALFVIVRKIDNQSAQNVIPAKAGIQWGGDSGLDSLVKPKNDKRRMLSSSFVVLVVQHDKLRAKRSNLTRVQNR